MNHVLDLWTNIDSSCRVIMCVDDSSQYQFFYLVQLLPIEMVSLCDIVTKVNLISDRDIAFVNWVSLSKNANLNLSLILKYKNRSWNWDALSCNRTINLEFITNYPEFPWNYRFISKNRNLNITYIINNRDRPWDWECVSANKTITLSDIRNNPQFTDGSTIPWNYKGLSANPNITVEFIVGNITNVKEFHGNSNYLNKWDWNCLSKNKAITMDDVSKNSWLPWSYKSLSKNPNLTIAFVLNNPTKLWDWISISRNKSITIKDINDNPEFENGSKIPWNYEGIWANPNITMQFILEKSNVLRYWCIITRNKAITIENILAHPKLLWSGEGLALNPNINLEFIMGIINQKLSHVRFYDKGLYFVDIWSNPAIFIY